DVHLGAPGRAEGGAADQLAHGVDTVVGRGVEFVDVERRAVADLGARVAGVVGLAVDHVGAGERLGEDAVGGRFALAARPPGQAGVGDLVVAHGVAQRPDDVVLAAHVGEPLRPVPAVERLVRLIRHDRRLYAAGARQ